MPAPTRGMCRRGPQVKPPPGPSERPGTSPRSVGFGVQLGPSPCAAESRRAAQSRLQAQSERGVEGVNRASHTTPHAQCSLVLRS